MDLRKPRLTRDEVRAVIETIEHMIESPGGEVKARRYMRDHHGWSGARTNKYIQKIFRLWKTSDEKGRAYSKTQAVRRIMRTIEEIRAKGARSPKGMTAADFANIATFEAQLSKIQGTEEPLALNVKHELTPVMANVFGNLTPEQLAAMTEEYDQLVETASKVKRLPAHVVDAEIVPDDES